MPVTTLANMKVMLAHRLWLEAQAASITISMGDMMGDGEAAAANLISKIRYINRVIGGETGIRTLGGVTPTTVFETAPFDHSGTSPLIPWSGRAHS